MIGALALWGVFLFGMGLLCDLMYKHGTEDGIKHQKEADELAARIYDNSFNDKYNRVQRIYTIYNPDEFSNSDFSKAIMEHLIKNNIIKITYDKSTEKKYTFEFYTIKDGNNK